LLALDSPLVDRCVHLVYIDDLVLVSPQFDSVAAAFDACMAAYASAGLPDSAKKRQAPTRKPNTIKGIGVCMDGETLTLSIAVEERMELARDTLRLLRSPSVTGHQLARLIGSWTWCLLLRRPALCVLQHAYRFIAAAREREFTLWPSVRKELLCLLCLLPLLQCSLAADFLPHVYASDASSQAAGVVYTRLTGSLGRALYPVSSSPVCNLLPILISLNSDSPSVPAHLLPDMQEVAERVWAKVDAARWRVLVSSPWRHAQHVNALELHAAALALRHALSHPHALDTRVFLLVDSSVAFYTLWKGRTSSSALSPVLRQINSLLLVSGMSLQPCWVPSEWNPADAPSRRKQGGGVGDAGGGGETVEL